MKKESKIASSGEMRADYEAALAKRRKEFGDAFVALARSVYRNNDRRAALKREVDALVGSEIVEEQSYSAY